MFVKRYFAAAALAATFALAAVAAQAQNNSKEIMALEPAKLVEILKNPGAPVFDKAKACQRLAVVGNKDAVPALAALLSDETLNLYARFGLEGIPDPAVDEALRTAAGKLQGRQLLGVLNSLGQRKDTAAVGLLKGLLSNSEASVVSAAATALGRIGTPEAAAALKEALVKASPAKGCLGNACMACAEVLAAAGKKAEAKVLYETVAQADLPKHQKTGALYGQFLLGKNDKEFVLTQLRSADEMYFGLGLAMARQTPGADVTTALLAEMDKLPADRQARLLRVLGYRADRVPTATIVAATKSASPLVSEAAIQVLAGLNDASVAGILLDSALSESSVASIAKEGLKNLTGAGVDAAIIAKLAGGNDQAQLLLVELAGARRIASAQPAVVAAVKSANPALRVAALTALGFLIELKDFDLLVGPALAGNDSPETKAAKDALRAAALGVGDREASAAKIVALLKGATGTNRDYLLDLLAKIGGKTALAAVVGDAKSADAAIKDAATKSLGDWPNAEAAAALLELAKNETDNKYRIRAMRGYIRIARQLQLTDDERLTMFETVMATAARKDEKQLALDILTRIPSPKTLQVAVTYVGERDLKGHAAEAAVKIATKLVNADPKAVAVEMQKVVDAKIAGHSGTRAKELLEQAKASAK